MPKGVQVQILFPAPNSKLRSAIETWLTLRLSNAKPGLWMRTLFELACTYARPTGRRTFWPTASIAHGCRASCAV